MINVEVNNMTDAVKELHEGAEERLSSRNPIRQFYGYGIKEKDAMKENEKMLKEEIDKMEERDRLKSLLDELQGDGVLQDHAVAYAYGYFEAVTDRDADEMYTAGDILDILHALNCCVKNHCEK